MLFARRGLRLEEYCVENKISYIPFDTFADIQSELARLVQEDQEVTHRTVQYNPRANFWRRASSKKAVPTLSSIQASATPVTGNTFLPVEQAYAPQATLVS